MKLSTASNNNALTTIIVKGVPRQHTAWDVLEEFDRFLSRSEFDFIYVPRKRYAKSNQGFTFINFVDASTAESGSSRITANRWGHTGRPMVVARADVQGLPTNLRRFQRAVLQSGGGELFHEPLVFENGHRVLFSAAIEKFCSEAMEPPPAEFLQAEATVLPPAHDLFHAKMLSNIDIFEDVVGFSSESVMTRHSPRIELQSLNDTSSRPVASTFTIETSRTDSAQRALPASSSPVRLRPYSAERPLPVDRSSVQQLAEFHDWPQPAYLARGPVYSF